MNSDQTEQAKNRAIAASIGLHADEFLNKVEKDIKIFLDRRGDVDASMQAAKVKKELGDLIDSYVDGKMGA